MKKLLFLINDLGSGGAERVLVNLANNMDKTEFDVTVKTLFDVGANRDRLDGSVRYEYCFKRVFSGNSRVMKLLSPRMLHRMFIKEHYDIEVAYLEGPAARIISGCKDKTTKLVSWIHSTAKPKEAVNKSFRSYAEERNCYLKFDEMVCVSEGVRDAFCRRYDPPKKPIVLYNTNDSEEIATLACEPVDVTFRDDEIKIVGVGKVTVNKGFDRLARIHKRLRDEGFPIHTYIIGEGNARKSIEQYLNDNGIADSFTFLGRQTNPYKYMSRCDLFVCASHAEGFSTAATEALILGTPVCTVEVNGMKEMLGERGEYGVVTENDDDALYRGIRSLSADPALLAHYRQKAAERGKIFNTETTVKAVEGMFGGLFGGGDRDER